MVKDINEPRYPSLLRIKRVAKVEIPIWGAAELGLSASVPAAKIAARVPPPPRAKRRDHSGADAAAKVRTLVDKLIESQVI